MNFYQHIKRLGLKNLIELWLCESKSYWIMSIYGIWCDLVHNQNEFVAKTFVAQTPQTFGKDDVYHFRKWWMSFCAVELLFFFWFSDLRCSSFSAGSEWKPKTSLNVAPNASICSYCGMLSIDDSTDIKH